MAAHRLNTLQDVDKIFYLHKGKIIEKGKYSELIGKNGAFYKLLNS
jgi:ABC-type multidrug transport system fused ATPase/permease subunit